MRKEKLLYSQNAELASYFGEFCLRDKFIRLAFLFSSWVNNFRVQNKRETNFVAPTRIDAQIRRA